MVKRLGDSKESVRTVATQVLLRFMEVVGPAIVWARVAPAAGDRSWRVRAQVGVL